MSHTLCSVYHKTYRSPSLRQHVSHVTCAILRTPGILFYFSSVEKPGKVAICGKIIRNICVCSFANLESVRPAWTRPTHALFIRTPTPHPKTRIQHPPPHPLTLTDSHFPTTTHSYSCQARPDLSRLLSQGEQKVFHTYIVGA